MRIRTSGIALAAAVLIGMTACSSSATSTESKPTGAPAAGSMPSAAASGAAVTTQAPAPAGTTAASPAPAGTTAASPAPTGPGGLPPKPDAVTQAKYIASLNAIDPEIVGGEPDLAVSRGRDQCSSVFQYPKEQSMLLELNAKRFTSPQHPDGFGGDKNARILTVVRTLLCPTYR